MVIKTRFVFRITTLFSFLLIIRYNHLTNVIFQGNVDIIFSPEADQIASVTGWNPSSQLSRQHQTSLPARFAYAFLLTECDPSQPQRYRGPLFSILANAQVLESTGSTADIVIMVQMSHRTTAKTLPDEDVAYLKSFSRVIVHYLPPPPQPSSMPPPIYQLQMEKFRILELTQYSRVVYLDPAVMILCHLDYLFTWSEQDDTQIQDNIALAGNNEPAMTTFMMLRPGPGEYQQLLQITERQIATFWSSNVTWNETIGWGHPIKSPDRWRTRYDIKSGSRWNFPLAYADQGLLYHWAKYVKKSVSIFIGNEVEHWSSRTNNDGNLEPPRLLAKVVNPIKGHECSSRLDFPYDKHTKPPYDLEGQMWHFWKEPPWMVKRWNKILKATRESSNKPYRMWFQHLMEVERRIQVRLDMKQLRSDVPPSSSWISLEDVQTAFERQHAYVFLMAGCDPTRPSSYRGIMFHILVAAHILESSGSKADIVVMIQMSFQSKATSLPENDLYKFRAYPSIVLHYLPKPLDSINFYELQLLKFHMLELSSYRRVLYLDADVMPMCNLDHLFHLSERGVLKENVIVASKFAPASGHFMMLRPNAGDFAKLLQIVEQRDARILATARNGTFDRVNGWGHVIQPPDRWRAKSSNGTRWNFPAAFADRGLVYHWAKYVKKSVSIFIGNDIEHWSPQSTHPVLGATSDALKGVECKSQVLREEIGRGIESHIWHFQNDRPWMLPKGSPKLKSYPYRMWSRTLRHVKRRLNITKTELNHRAPLWRSQTLRADFVKSLERKYAYAFLLADCDPARPSGFRGLLYGIMVNAQLLHNAGSTADIVVMVQMSHRTNATILETEDVAHLKTLFPRVVIHYLPKPRQQLSFYEAQLAKMHVLELTRYRRVIFLDADVVLLCNLDYLFHLSEKGVLKDNMLLAERNEPANGGFVMLRPGVGEFEQVQQIIECRDAHIIHTSPNLRFDPVFGWGHVIQPPDRWRSRAMKGTLWNFSAGFADQGLLYHWAKYVKKSASLFVNNEVENWSALNDTSSSDPVLEATIVNPLKGHGCTVYPELYQRLGRSLYSLEGQFLHFCGNDRKPWTVKDPSKVILDSDRLGTAYRVWFDAFRQIQRRLNITLDASKDLQHRSMMKHYASGDEFKIILGRKKKNGIVASC